MKGLKIEGSPPGALGTGSAAVPEALGGRSTKESMPYHEASMGYLEGGDRGITNIQEEQFADDGA